uniref:Coilin n=1 Tax=Leptobrachium leishanense TaxID=445787 RepID=A0A8C5RAK2_9ANUR
MAAPSEVRVKLLFDFPPPAVPQSSTLWFLLDQSKCRVVADLTSVIRDRFFYGLSGGISLYLENGLLIPGESVHVVRDNDSIKVQWEGSNQEADLQSTMNNVSPPKMAKRHRLKSKKNSSREPDLSLHKSPRSSSPVEIVRLVKRRRSEVVPDDQSDVPAESPPRKINSDSKRRRKIVKDVHSDVPVKKQCKKNLSSDTRKVVMDIHSDGPAETPNKKTTSSSKMRKSKVVKDIHSEKLDTETTSSDSRRKSKVVKDTDVPPEKPYTETISSGSRRKSKVVKDVHLDVPPEKPYTETTSDSRRPVMTDIHSSSPAEKQSSNSKVEANFSNTDSSDSDTFVIKKSSAAAMFPPHPLHLPNGNSVSPVGVQHGSEPNSRTFGRGRGPFPWRGQGGHGLRIRGPANYGRGRGNCNYFFNYDAEAKEQHLNESATNQSIVIQNPVDIPKKDYSALPLLTSLPEPGRVIAFKLLELSDSYSPEVSDYKEGRILRYDPGTQDLELEILSLQTTKKEPGKFDLVYEREDGSSSVEYAVTQDSKIIQKWSSLIEPRLVEETRLEGPVLQTESTDP